MTRSLLREEQFRDSDVLSEWEHDNEAIHYYRKLADVTTYSGHANEFVVANASGTGLTFTQSSAGLVEDLYNNSNLIMSTASDGIVIVNNSDAVYFGAPTISGSWRIRVLDGNLLFEKYDGASWNEKFTMDESGEPLLSIY
jgi:hypothetical protein